MKPQHPFHVEWSNTDKQELLLKVSNFQRKANGLYGTWDQFSIPIFKFTFALQMCSFYTVALCCTKAQQPPTFLRWANLQKGPLWNQPSLHYCSIWFCSETQQQLLSGMQPLSGILKFKHAWIWLRWSLSIPHTGEAEAGRSWVWGHPELYTETANQTKKKPHKKKNSFSSSVVHSYSVTWSF